MRVGLQIHLLAKHKVWRNPLKDECSIAHLLKCWENYMTKDRSSDDAVEEIVRVGLRFSALVHSEDLLMAPPL